MKYGAVRKFFRQFFDKRGYPVAVVQAGQHRAQQIDRQSALSAISNQRALFTQLIYSCFLVTIFPPMA